MIKKIIVLPFAAVWAALTFAVGRSLYQTANAVHLNKEFEIVFVGAAAFFVSSFLVSPDKYEFLNILLHELSHAIFSVFTFSKPQRLTVDVTARSELGSVNSVPIFDNVILSILRQHIVSLSPYFFPIFPGIVMLTIVFSKFVSPVQLFLLGFLYAHHVVIILKTARPNQTDFSHLGYFYGLTFVIFMNSVFFALAFVAVTHASGTYDIMLYELKDSIHIILDEIHSLRFKSN